jgi:hypothetical protein
MSRSSTAWCLLLAAGMSLVVSGCWSKRPKLVPVSGVVTVDGKPLTSGFVRVLPESGRPSGGTVGSDGHFTLGCLTDDDGCMMGTHKVEVQGFENLPGNRRKWLAPRKYAGTATSGLTATIDAPTDALRIELTWADSAEKGPLIEAPLNESRGGKGPGK